MQPRCHDTSGSDRCERRLGHVEGEAPIHKNGHRTWASRNLPEPAWRANLTAVDRTRAVLTGPPL